MKLLLNPISSLMSKTCLTCLLLLTLVVDVTAQTNLFNDPENTASTDTYPGDPGNGWAEGWTFQFGVNNGNPGFFGVEPHVLNTTPLFGGGNYLNWGMANSESSMRRKYVSNGSLNSGLAHIIEFDIRLDAFLGTFTSSSDNIAICTRRNLGSDAGGNATFWIKAQAANDSGAPLAKAGSWNFYDGGLLNSSDASGNFTNSAGVVSFAIGRAYHFKVALDPQTKTYVGTVTDGTNTFTTGPLRYKSYSDNNFNNISNSTIFQVVSRTSTRTAVPPGPTETNIVSLDNIKIYADLNAIAPVITQQAPAPSHIFFPSGSNLVFTAETLGPDNSLPAAGTILLLNGNNASGGLSLSGSDTDKVRTISYTGLADNTIYNGTLIVADQAGRSTTNSFYFDTFVETNVTVIEAENYNFETTSNSCAGNARTNFNAAGYLQNPLPSDIDLVNGGYINEVDGYVDRAGVFGVDYFDAVANVISEYRICDMLDTRKKAAAEFLRPAYVTHLANDFMLEHIEAGDWANYTHVYPGSNYLVYLRVGARNVDVHYDLARVTSNRTQPNQTTVSVGTFAVPRLAARETLRYRPLADAFGNPVLLHLNGEQTLRLTATDASSNDDTYVNFMLFSPQPGSTAPPFVSGYYPKSGESNIPPQTAITLTLANGSSPVAAGTIVLNVNGSNVTSLATITPTANGAAVSYLPATFFPRPSFNTVQIIYGDGSGPLQTNQWSFHVGTYLPGIPIKVNFVQPTSTNFPGYLKDTSLTFADRGNGFSYGWDRDFTEDTRQNFGPAVATPPDDVPAPDQRYATFTHLNKASPPRVFEITIPNGNYGVFAVSGDATAIDSIFKIAVEGVVVVDGTPAFPDQWVSGSNVVTVADGRLTLTSVGGNNNKINFIDIWPLDYPEPNFRIQNPAINGANFGFQITTIQRALHIIESTTNISSPVWTVVTNIVGTGGSVSVAAPVDGTRFYRMRIP